MKGLVVPAREWWPSYSSPSQPAFEFRYSVTPIRPLSTRGASFTGGVLNSWGASLIGQVVAMPLFWILLVLTVALSKRSFQTELSLVLYAGLSVIASVFIGGVGLEPRYVYPSTAIFLLYLLTMWPRPSHGSNA